MALLAVVFIGACYVYDPTLRLLLFSALPDTYQSWFTFIMCFVVEMHLLLMFYGVGVVVLQIQVISFDMVSANLKASMRGAQNRYSEKFKK